MSKDAEFGIVANVQETDRLLRRRYGRKDTHLPDEQELISQLEVTEEMIEAGIEAAWEEPNAPPSVRFIVERVYRAMEAKRRSAL